jgi:hypothetical protein
MTVALCPLWPRLAQGLAHGPQTIPVHVCQSIPNHQYRVERQGKTGRGGVMRTVTSRGSDEACETRPLLAGRKQMIRSTDCSPPIVWYNKHQTIRTEGRGGCLSDNPKPQWKVSYRALLSVVHLCSPNPRYRTSTVSRNSCLRGRLSEYIV